MLSAAEKAAERQSNWLAVSSGNKVCGRKISHFGVSNSHFQQSTNIHISASVVYRSVVNEAGSSIYSVSSEAQEEMPDLEPNLRSAVSIARRLQDPLAELVKIDPKHVGIGLYQVIMT